jgi:hypothetical protein
MTAMNSDRTSSAVIDASRKESLFYLGTGMATFPNPLVDHLGNKGGSVRLRMR